MEVANEHRGQNHSWEMEIALKIIGGKCKQLILYLLIADGTKRFNEFMSSITQISLVHWKIIVTS